MSTTTVNRPLAEQMVERWRRERADPKYDIESGDPIGDATYSLYGALVDPYQIYEDDQADRPIANAWFMELEATIDAAVISAWEEQIVPKVIAAVIKKLPTAPEYLKVHPDSKQLRADLEALVTAQ